MARSKTKIRDQLPAAVAELPDALLYDLLDLLNISPPVWQEVRALMREGRAWFAAWQNIRGKQRYIYSVRFPETSEYTPFRMFSRAILHQVLFRIPVHRCCHGACEHTSIVTNARVHAGFARSVYTLDLKDAYPRTAPERVMQIVGPMVDQFLADAIGDLTAPERSRLSRALLALCVPDSQLPQGFPTSPQILNLVLRPCDAAIARTLRQIAAERECEFRYTRYLDDHTISTDQARFLNEDRKKIRGVFRKHGWQVSAKKVHHYTANPVTAPKVTGILIHPDGRLTLPPSSVKRYRAIFHRICSQDRSGKPLTELDLQRVRGVIAYLQMVYEGDLPSALREGYAEARQRFGSAGRAGFAFYPRDA